MLNEQVESLLSQDGHGVYVFKSRVDVLDTATINHAENYIQMRQISDHYEVGKIRRGRFSKIAETEDKDLASAYTYILSKAIYDEPIDGDIARRSAAPHRRAPCRRQRWCWDSICPPGTIPSAARNSSI